MKRIRSKVLVLVSVFIIGITGFAAAGGGGEKGEKKVTIGVSLPTQREDIWVKGKEAMEAEAKRLGVDVKIMLADANVAEQASQVENLLSQGIDVLILAPVDSDAVSTLVDKAKDDNVPVINFARLANNCDVDYYITFDNVMVGELQGEYLLNNIPDGSNIIVMSGAPTDNLAGLFKRGAMNKITPAANAGKVKIVAEQAVENWLPENAMKIVENALTQNRNNIQGILAPNDGTAGGAIQALDAQGLKGKVVVTGQDSEAAAVRRILAGEQSMTIFKDIRELAIASIQAANKYALKDTQGLEVSGTTNNGRMDVPTLFIPPTIITKDNAVDVLVRSSGYLKESDIR
ncbi:sugar ABC transporter substrate-binding protein [Breznakiella homolactica]|uniref:Substrate-binding domain-containing protein n=1 Tax=Breznakiella homolactica TaxID=2798577 RepID=A0A7T8BBH6_9SPIR|nr:substrate-binding domain-containing protein [Breznakiella homolactica]QQO10577.1 substrate-binding domain-containing protein [Breznakiella homolactica]